MPSSFSGEIKTPIDQSLEKIEASLAQTRKREAETERKTSRDARKTEETRQRIAREAKEEKARKIREAEIADRLRHEMAAVRVKRYMTISPEKRALDARIAAENERRAEAGLSAVTKAEATRMGLEERLSTRSLLAQHRQKYGRTPAEMEEKKKERESRMAEEKNISIQAERKATREREDRQRIAEEKMEEVAARVQEAARRTVEEAPRETATQREAREKRELETVRSFLVKHEAEEKAETERLRREEEAERQRREEEIRKDWGLFMHYLGKKFPKPEKVVSEKEERAWEEDEEIRTAREALAARRGIARPKEKKEIGPESIKMVEPEIPEEEFVPFESETTKKLEPIYQRKTQEMAAPKLTKRPEFMTLEEAVEGAAQAFKRLEAVTNNLREKERTGYRLSPESRHGPIRTAERELSDALDIELTKRLTGKLLENQKKIDRAIREHETDPKALAELSQWIAWRSEVRSHLKNLYVLDAKIRMADDVSREFAQNEPGLPERSVLDRLRDRRLTGPEEFRLQLLKRRAREEALIQRVVQTGEPEIPAVDEMQDKRDEEVLKSFETRLAVRQITSSLRSVHHEIESLAADFDAEGINLYRPGRINTLGSRLEDLAVDLFKYESLRGTSDYVRAEKSLRDARKLCGKLTHEMRMKGMIRGPIRFNRDLK